MEQKKYKAKVLLFGEYTVITGSNALAMPADIFSGHWDFNEEEAKIQRDILFGFHQYLSSLEFDKAIYQDHLFQRDLNQDLVFHADIPIGYGLGSSGAVTAAIFDRYFQKDNQLNPIELKDILGLMESYFHGSSSGLDPLISYLEKAVLIKNGAIEFPKLPEQSEARTFFLIDTEMPRKTAPLVELFLKKYQSEKFQKVIDDQLVKLNNQATDYFLADNTNLLFETVHHISKLQSDHFQEMIPEAFRILWKEGLNSDNFKLKLCGAGGGGFILGMTNKPDQLSTLDIKHYLLNI